MHISETLHLKHADERLPQPAKPIYQPIFQVTSIEQLKSSFEKIGIIAGDILMVHAALSSLDYLPGGARSLLQTLLNVVTPSGTLVFPSFTGDNSDPFRWRAPPAATHAIREEIIRNSPPYDPILSQPWKRVGQLPAVATLWPNAVRSFHPQLSFTAIGAQAQDICGKLEENLDYPLAQNGVLGRLSKTNARVLFIGTNWNTCTGLHLIEHMLFNPVPEHLSFEETSVILNGQKRCYVNYKMLKQSTADFDLIGERLERENPHLFLSQPLKHSRMLLFPYQKTLECALPLMKQSRK